MPPRSNPDIAPRIQAPFVRSDLRAGDNGTQSRDVSVSAVGESLLDALPASDRRFDWLATPKSRDVPEELNMLKRVCPMRPRDLQKDMPRINKQDLVSPVAFFLAS